MHALNIDEILGKRPREYSWRFRFRELAFTNRIDEAILAEAISRPRIDLGIPKSDQIHFSMRRSSLVLDLWLNFELSLTKNRA